MDTRIKEFIKLNKDNIASVYNFKLSSGDYVVYIFTKKLGCTRLDLVTDAHDTTTPNIIYIDSVELPQELEECVGTYVEI